MKFLDTGEAELLEAAEAEEKAAAVAARETFADRAKQVVADHPVATIGAAGGAVALLAVASRNPSRVKLLKAPARMAVASFFGAIF